MAAQAEEQHLLITTHGMDGACSAAMLLQKFPKAEIVVTSARRIAITLEEIREWPKIPEFIHICGVGIEDDVNPVIEQLGSLQKSKRRIFWYCGRKYLIAWEKSLSAVCTTVFPESKSNTEATQFFHKIDRSERVDLLLALARQFVDDVKKWSTDHQRWRDLIAASEARYFKYGERSNYPQAIRKLAGISPFTNADEKEIKAYRSSGRHGVPLGESNPMKALRALIKRLGPIEESVLILGPTGSGKEIAARSLHEASNRAGQFIAVNCSVLSASADLAHDRLFGHIMGAYTGAKSNQTGAFEEADGGTLFLDEVAELPLSVQTQLLRVLEEGSVIPLGAMQSRPVNVRIIAATNQNIPALIGEGRFRSDLYHRLNVLQIQIPPVKERMEDLKSIANNLLYEMKKKGYPFSLSKDDWSAIYEYDWPGNIRQFINLLKRAIYMQAPFREILSSEIQILSTADSIHALSSAKDLLLFRPNDRSQVKPESAIRKSYLKHVLAIFEGNLTQAAEALELSINTLRKWVSED